MQKYQYVIPLFISCVLSACSDKPAPLAAPAAAPQAAPAVRPAASKEDLMKAVFGQQYRPATGDALTTLPMLRDRVKIRYYLVKPLTTTVLNTGETVLVAQADYADQNKEEDNEAIEDQTLLNVYLLRQTAGTWSVLKRHENFMFRGENSGPGSILFPMLNKDRQGLAVVDYLSDEGCPSRILYLFDLSQDALLSLTDGIRTEWTVNRLCSENESDPDESLSSIWYLAPPKKAAALYNDLVIVSTTTTTLKAGPARDKPVTTIGKKVAVRYAHDGKHYQVAGAK